VKKGDYDGVTKGEHDENNDSSYTLVNHEDKKRGDVILKTGKKSLTKAKEGEKNSDLFSEKRNNIKTGAIRVIMTNMEGEIMEKERALIGIWRMKTISGRSNEETSFTAQ